MAEIKAILMTEEAWINSPFSVAKYSGGITISGEGGKQRMLLIVDKHGRDLTQTGIPPGEPADLVDKEFIPYYKKLGRDKFIAFLKANTLLGRDSLKKAFKEEVDKVKAEQETKKAEKKAELDKRYPPIDFQ